MSRRVRTLGPWLLTTAVLAAGVCAVGWPVPTGWAVGAAVGTWALVWGVRRFLEEQRNDPGTARPECAGCIGCGGPDCIERPDELTAEEARALATELGLDLYRARDALAYVAECCDIADREHHAITTSDVRTWLKGAQCARQTGLVLPANETEQP